MKQMYIKPIVEQAEMLPQSIICASNPSITGGGDTGGTGIGGGDPLGD